MGRVIFCRAMRRFPLVIGAALALVAATPRAQGPAPKPMSIVDLAGVPRLLDPQLAPNGKSVIYTLTRADWQANRAVGQIWRQAIGGGSPVQLTTQDGGATTARWSPDGRTIAFVARGSDGNQQLFLQPAAGGDARPLTQHATSVSQPSWAPDSAALYFVASDERSADARERDRLRDDVYAFDETYTQRHLWKVVVGDGAKPGAESRLTSGSFSVLSYRLSRDGSRIVTHRAPTPLAGDAAQSEVWVSAADGSAARAVTSNGVEETDGELSPDNARVLFVAEASATLEPYHSARVFVAPASGGSPRPLASNVSYALERAAWSPDGASVLAVANMGVHSEIVRIDAASGKTEALTSGRHSVQFWSLSREAGRMVFQLDEPERLGRRLDARRRGRSARARHGRLRHAVARFRAAPAGEGGLAGRRRHRARGPALLSDRVSGRAPLSPGRPAPRRSGGIGQVRLRAGRHRQLRAGARRPRLRGVQAELPR